MPPASKNSTSRRAGLLFGRTALGARINHRWENVVSLPSNKLVLTRPSELTSFNNEWRALG